MTPAEKAARAVGVAVQVLVLGTLLALALLQLIVAAQGGTTFRYAGF